MSRSGRTTRRAGRLAIASAIVLLSAAALPLPVWAQPAFSKAFEPATIGPGSTAELILTIDNDSGAPVTDLAFTDPLPAGVVLATPASPVSDCDGTLSAPDGGGTVTLAGGSVGAFLICRVRVNVTSNTPGVHTNTSGELTSSAGNSGTASADLTVANDRAGFTKSFSPAAIQLGARTRLTFLIDNTANTEDAFNLQFNDALPDGLEVAEPPNLTTDCPRTAASQLTATPGSGTISYSSGFLATATLDAGTSCAIGVDLVAVGAGARINRSGNLTAQYLTTFAIRDSGFAVAGLQIDVDELALTKAFTDDPVQPGGTTTLRFSITNFSRGDGATGVSFSDDLNATLSGLVPVPPLPVDPCGAGSDLSGTSLLTLSGGNLAAGETCTFDVTLAVPVGATPGAYPNTTSPVSGDVGGVPTTGAAATDTLFVQPVPLLEKTFLDPDTLTVVDSVAAGDEVVVEFRVVNGSSTLPASGIAFSDNLTAFLSGTTATALPPPDPCGPGSAVSQSVLFGEALLTLDGGNLPAGGSCTFQATLLIPVGAPIGTFTNTTSGIEAIVDGGSVFGPPATAALSVLAAPQFGKSFSAGVAPGGTVDLQFSLALSENAPTPATDIAFTDDLDAALTGLTATALPADGFCGPGSQITGISTLTVTGASLSPGEACAFALTVQVPAGAIPGDYPNTTSPITAIIDGTAVSGPAVTADLRVLGLQTFKAFTGGPFVVGGTATLEFTLDNTASPLAASGISFTDDLGDAVPGMTPTGLPLDDVCGTGSQLALGGSDVLVFSGGSLAAGESCSFPVNVQIPDGTAPAQYLNVTSSVAATVDGTLETFDPAAAELEVIDPLAFSKEFIDDPVEPGETVTLEFTLTNNSPTDPATALAFTDDLNAALTGLATSAVPADGFCGPGSQATGGGVLTITGANLAPDSSCTFQVTVLVPAGAAAGTTVVNTTSALSGTVGGAAATAPAASDVLRIDVVGLTKAFAGPAVAGSNVVLTFTIDNLSTSLISGLAFTDDLDAALAGLQATALPSAPCGAGSTIGGASQLTFSGGTLAAGTSCSFDVTLQVPAGAAPGTFTNTTSQLFADGIPVGSAASDDLRIEPPPGFAKAFAEAQMPVGDTTTLTFTIDNSASALAATSLAFFDPLPAGLEVAASPAVVDGCGGTTTAVPGSGLIQFAGGAVGAGGVCTISVEITATQDGALTNTTGDLTSSSGNSGTASDDILIDPPPPPGFVKVFAPDSLPTGATSTLTFTIDNAAALVAADSLAFTDNLPAGMEIANPANAVNGCGGTLGASPGATVIGLSAGSVAAGAECTVAVDVTTTTPGVKTNTTSDLTSSSGNSGTASDTLVARVAPLFSKAFAPATIQLGQTATLTLTIDNSAETVAATGLDFTDPLPAGMTIATPANATTNCTGGTLTAAAGASTLSYTGGSVAAGATCTVSVDVTGQAVGALVNTTGALTSSLGDSGTTAATLSVTEDSDGVPASVEDQAPNNGDGNDDGIPDGTQDSVASLPTFDGARFMTVEIISGCDQLNNVAAGDPAGQGALLPNQQFPFGLVGFELPCESAVVDVIFHDSAGLAQRYFKFGPVTPGDPATATWYDFSASGGATGAAFAGGGVWTLSLVDNALGDATGDDGRIVDPGGPAIAFTPVPVTTGFWLVLLALAMAALSVHTLRHATAVRHQPARAQSSPSGKIVRRSPDSRGAQ